jgi:ATP-dependent DNA helicase RecG
MIQTSSEQLDCLINRVEDCNIEFKKAAHNFDSRELRDYCAALANERGGKLLLGVQQKPDKKGDIIGTTVYQGTHNKLSNELLNELGIRVDVEEIFLSGKRVLVFHVPSRSTGSVIRSTGHYKIPMRAGESLCEMDDQTLKSIMNETAPDFSARPVPTLTINDLEPAAIINLRRHCSEHVGNQNYSNCSEQQLLIDLGLMNDNAINYAGLILLGAKAPLDRLLPQAEIIFEWRQVPGKISHDFRKTWRQSFLTIIDEIWRELESRNIRTPFQEGFIQREVFAFDERSIREAVLNAVAHRDYSIGGQVVFITASPDGFLIESPGGFLPGITPENAVYSRAWRNQRLAEVFEKAGLVERSGQGLDFIFEKSIRSGKGTPDLTKSTLHSVKLFIPALLKDPEFILYLEKIINEQQIGFSFEEMMELENIREQVKVSDTKFKGKFLSAGIIEKIGIGKGTHYILAQKYYAHKNELGVHTMLSGLERDTYKELIMKHIKEKKQGTARQFQPAFKDLKPMDISNLLRELKTEGKIVRHGSKSHGYWTLPENATDYYK